MRKSLMENSRLRGKMGERALLSAPPSLFLIWVCSRLAIKGEKWGKERSFLHPLPLPHLGLHSFLASSPAYFSVSPQRGFPLLQFFTPFRSFSLQQFCCQSHVGIVYSQRLSCKTPLSQIRGATEIDSQYLTELLAEHQKLGPFVQGLPICSRLLNQGMETDAFEMEKHFVFIYEEIISSSSAFSDSNLVSHGTHGYVYFGVPRNQEVANKRMSAIKTKEFMAEIKALSKVHHASLVGDSTRHHGIPNNHANRNGT